MTTSYLTHAAIESHLTRTGNYGHDGPVFLSRGQSIGQRLVPMTRDLTFLWEEATHETLDENVQKVREAGRRAILEWARSQGEGSDYTDNLPIQRFTPPGHFYEVPNLLRNGLLGRLLLDYPNLKWLMVHNIDTLGATLDPGSPRAGHARATPRSASRSFRDGSTTAAGDWPGSPAGSASWKGWPSPARKPSSPCATTTRSQPGCESTACSQTLHLTREDLTTSPEKVAAAIRGLAARVPTYVTIKDVKRRWGHGQEDVFPVAQFEKLWGDLSSLPDLPCAFLAVGRLPGTAAQGRGPARRLGHRRQPRPR